MILPCATILEESFCKRNISILLEKTSPSTEAHFNSIFSNGVRESYVFRIITKKKRKKNEVKTLNQTKKNQKMLTRTLPSIAMVTVMSSKL